VKSAAWFVTDSVAIISTLIDSVLDALASVVTLLAVHHAVQPADREHRFGHGKAEALAGLGQAAFITGSSVLLMYEAVSRLTTPQPIANEFIGIGVMGFSILLTLGLVSYQQHVVRKTASVAIGADRLHYVSDLLVNAAVIVALLATSYLGRSWIDPALAVLVALYILWSAWRIVRGVLDILMDRELPDEERLRIREIVLAHKAVQDMHDLRSRRSGTNTFIQLHIELDGAMRLIEAHAIADAVEADIRDAFPGAEVIIHQDPAGIEEDHPKVAFR